MMEVDNSSDPGGAENTHEEKTHRKFIDYVLDQENFVTHITEEDLKTTIGYSNQKINSQPITQNEEEKIVYMETVPFVEAALKEAEKTRTENGAVTFSTTGGACLDFYLNIMEGSKGNQTLDLLQKSWDESPLSAFKLVASLRDIKKGKGIRTQYQYCLYWLYNNHPLTLYNNLEELVTFGYWKDLLHFIMTICFNGFVPTYLVGDDCGKKSKKNIFTPDEYSLKILEYFGQPGCIYPKEEIEQLNTIREQIRNFKSIARKKEKQMNKKKYLLGVSHFSEQNKSTLQDLIEEERRAIKAMTEKMSTLRLKYAREKFKNDLKYRIFHVKVAQIFAQQLIKDKKESEHSTKKISLAGKWAPSLKKHFDRYTLIGTTISTEIFKITKDLGYSPEDFPHLCFEHEECTFAKQIYLARKNYRTNYYVKLHTDLKVPEIFMTSGKWQEIEYNRVPAKCMTKNRSSFLKHDKNRFEAFIMSPYNKVAGGTLTPIQLINRAFKVMKLKQHKNIEEILLQKQWESLVESIQSKSNCLLSNAVSICDVSASMDGDPMLAAIGLTLMTLEKSNPPWNNICITFSQHPQFHKVNPDITFIEKVNSLKNMIWGANTNFDAVFDLILDLAKKNNLKQSEMPSILLVFTDMEFDVAFHKPNKTNFENAKQKFEANNYEMPNVVFWNLRAKAKGQETSPVQKDENGVLLLSGYSSKMLSYILDFTDDNFAENISHELTPEKFLNQVVNDERYSNLVIYD